MNLKKDSSRDYRGLLYAAFASCKGEWPKSIEEASEHIKGCIWCQKWLKEYKKASKFISLSPRDEEEIRKQIRSLYNKE